MTGSSDMFRKSLGIFHGASLKAQEEDLTGGSCTPVQPSLDTKRISGQISEEDFAAVPNFLS